MRRPAKECHAGSLPFCLSALITRSGIGHFMRARMQLLANHMAILAKETKTLAYESISAATRWGMSSTVLSPRKMSLTAVKRG